MNELEQKVARAIDPAPWIALDNNSPDTIVNCPHRRVVSLSKAKAVIKAITEQGLVIVPREPTDEMVESGAWYTGDILGRWQAMISAAHQQEE